MAVTALPRGFYYPPLPPGVLEAATPGFVGGTLDAASEGGANMCAAPVSGNIAAIWWCTRTVTTGSTMEGRIETLSGGLPSGTLWGTNTNGTLVVANGDDNAILRIPLTANAAVLAGDQLAVIVRQPAASFGTLQIAQGTASDNNTRFPYGAANTSGSYAAFSSSLPNMMALEYDSGTIYGIDGVHPPATAVTSTSLSTSTTPDVIGARFQFATEVSVAGAWIWMDLDGDCNVRLVDTAYHQANATGILATCSMLAANRNATTPGVYLASFPSVSLSAATNYRLIVEPSSGTSLIFYDFTTISAALMNAWGGGADFHLTTAKDPTGNGSWTNFNSGTFRQPYIGLVLDGIGDTVNVPGGGVSRARFQRRM